MTNYEKAKADYDRAEHRDDLFIAIGACCAGALFTVVLMVVL